MNNPPPFRPGSPGPWPDGRRPRPSGRSDGGTSPPPRTGASTTGDVRNQTTDQWWRDSALCIQTDPAIFFPEVGETAYEAKRVCASCPVRTDCLIDALDRREPHGVHGGLTPNERRAVLREQRAGRRVRSAA